MMQLYYAVPRLVNALFRSHLEMNEKKIKVLQMGCLNIPAYITMLYGSYVYKPYLYIFYAFLKNKLFYFKETPESGPTEFSVWPVSVVCLATFRSLLSHLQLFVWPLL